ncbi:hypothetical protein ACHAWT_001192 [Skeletonema menzelii]
MPPHVQIDQHDDLQEASPPSHQCLYLNVTNASEQSPLFQDDLSSRAAASSPLDALRNDDDTTICDDSVVAGPPVKKPETKRITGIEAIIGSESRYAQNEIAVKNKSSSSSSSSTVDTASTSTTARTCNNGGEKVSKSSKLNSVLFPKDSMQRRKQIAGFFRKGKKIVSSIGKKKKSKTNP